MDIEEAKKYLRNYKDEEWYDKEVSEAIETVLAELEKKEAVINEMAKYICEDLLEERDVEQVKKAFYERVEREGK